LFYEINVINDDDDDDDDDDDVIIRLPKSNQHPNFLKMQSKNKK